MRGCLLLRSVLLVSLLWIASVGTLQAQQEPPAQSIPPATPAPAATQSPTAPAQSAPLPEVVVEQPAPAKLAKRKPAQPIPQDLAETTSAPAPAAPGEPRDPATATGAGALAPVEGYTASSALSATKTDTPILETPQAVTVVTRDLIEDRAARDVNDALSTVAGFAPNTDYIFDQAYSLRGFSIIGDSLYQKYRDGRRTPQVVPADIDLLERIEVIKGPSSVLYGQIEPGGLVNLVSKRAHIGKTGGFAEQEFASFDQFKTIVDVNASIADTAFRLPAAFSTGNSFRDAVEYESYDAAPAFTWDLSPETKVSILTTLGRKERTDDTISRPIIGGTTVLPGPRSRFLGEPSFENAIAYGSVTAEFEHKITPELTYRGAYTFFQSDREIEYALNNFAEPGLIGGQSLGRFGGTEWTFQEGHVTQHDLIWKTHAFGIAHEVLAGMDVLSASRDALINIGFLDAINVEDPTYNPTINPPFIFDGYRSKISSQQIGFYAQDNITLAQNLPAIHKLSLLVGGRFDIAKESLDTEGTIFFAPQTPARIDNDAFSPRAAVLWMPTERLSLYGSYSKSFNPQDPEQVSNFVSQTPEPTIGEQYEIGAKYQLMPKLFTTVALFDITKTNVPTTPLGSFFAVLTGEVRSRGIEFELNGEIVPGWQVAAGLAFLNTEVTDDELSGNVGNRLGGAPEDVFGLWTGYTFQPGHALAGFGFGGGLTYLSDVFVENSNLVGVPSYVIYDAAFWYRPEQTGPIGFDYQLNIRNLTDEDYLIAGNGFSAVQDGTARTVIGSVKMKF